MALDLDCFDDLDEFGGELTDPLAILEQDVYHLLLETLGSNLDDPDRGVGLEDALSGAEDPQLARRIEAQLRKDDRIAAVACAITKSTESNGPVTYKIDIRIDADAGQLGLLFTFDGKTLVRST